MMIHIEKKTKLLKNIKLTSKIKVVSSKTTKTHKLRFKVQQKEISKSKMSNKNDNPFSKKLIIIKDDFLHEI